MTKSRAISSERIRQILDECNAEDQATAAKSNASDQAALKADELTKCLPHSLVPNVAPTTTRPGWLLM